MTEPISYADIARAATRVDNLAEGGGVTETLLAFDCDPTGVLAAADQRALRLEILAEGQTMPRTNEPVMVEIADHTRMEQFAVAWLDGFVAGVATERARHG